jgi:hypothetical protein
MLLEFVEIKNRDSPRWRIAAILERVSTSTAQTNFTRDVSSDYAARFESTSVISFSPDP